MTELWPTFSALSYYAQQTTCRRYSVSKLVSLPPEDYDFFFAATRAAAGDRAHLLARWHISSNSPSKDEVRYGHFDHRGCVATLQVTNYKVNADCTLVTQIIILNIHAVSRTAWIIFGCQIARELDCHIDYVMC